MTLTVADWYQEELQFIHNCVPWVPVENSLFLVCVFLLPHLFTFTPAWYVADSVCEIMLDCLNCGGKPQCVTLFINTFVLTFSFKDTRNKYFCIHHTCSCVLYLQPGAEVKILLLLS